LLPAAISRVQMFAEGVQRSVTCADVAPMSATDTERDDAVLTDPGRWSTVLVIMGTQGCHAWPSGSSDPAILEPRAVDRKMLVLSGTLDPVTPTPVAEQVADAMGHATFVAIGGLGHGVFDDSACASDLITAYLARPALDLDTSCANQPAAIHFPGS
jgi:pimeloyl-ACP methyl ester carboxylesterase